MSDGRQVWWNGKFLPESEARISIYDSALLYGDMVFEMTRSFAGEQFRLEAHLKRLMFGCRALRIDPEFSLPELAHAVLETCEANKAAMDSDDEHRVMINVTRGLHDIYAGNINIDMGPNVIIADYPLRWTVKGMGKLYHEGVHAAVVSQRAISSHLLDNRIKHRSRLHLRMASLQADWPILLDDNGFVAEGNGWNIFIANGNRCYTPAGKNLLHGISRNYVRELTRVTEKQLLITDLYDAGEIFITATPFCILPVTQIDGRQVGSGEPGRMYRELLDKWSMSVGIDIAAQVNGWDDETV